MYSLSLFTSCPLFPHLCQGWLHSDPVLLPDKLSFIKVIYYHFFNLFLFCFNLLHSPLLSNSRVRVSQPRSPLSRLPYPRFPWLFPCSSSRYLFKCHLLRVIFSGFVVLNQVFPAISPQIKLLFSFTSLTLFIIVYLFNYLVEICFLY